MGLVKAEQPAVLPQTQYMCFLLALVWILLLFHITKCRNNSFESTRCCFGAAESTYTRQRLSDRHTASIDFRSQYCSREL